MYYEKFIEKKEAMSREYYIKKNRNFRNLIKQKSNEKKASYITSL